MNILINFKNIELENSVQSILHVAYREQIHHALINFLESATLIKTTIY